MNAAGSGREVADVVETVGDSTPVRLGARLGYAVSGLLHLVIAGIALKVAFGKAARGDRLDQSGALAVVAGTTGGAVLLWVGVVGFALLALWQAAEAVAPAPPGTGSDRAKAAGKAILYAALASSTFSFARGAGRSSASQTREVTAQLMSAPGGRWLVALVGLGVVAAGGYHVHKGWNRRFLRDLVAHPGTWAVHAGRVGYVAKGVALAVVGFLFVAAAWHARSAESTGLDGALRTLMRQPFGQILLGLVAAGLAAYGIYSLARARFARV